MTFTRAQETEIIEHVLNEIIGLTGPTQDNESIRHFLDHMACLSYSDFMVLDDDDFSNPEYRVEPPGWQEGNPQPPLRTLR